MDVEFRKKALRMISYGVYVITSKYADQYCASTITWVSQASFEPPMISICLKNKSNSYQIVKKREEFLLHLLGEDQKNMAKSFIQSIRINNELLNDQEYTMHEDLPLITNVPAFIHCRVSEIVEIGDHPLFLSEVIDAVILSDTNPLELRQTGWIYGG